MYVNCGLSFSISYVFLVCMPFEGCCAYWFHLLSLSYVALPLSFFLFSFFFFFIFLFYIGKDRYIIDIVCIQRSIDPGGRLGKTK